MKDKEKHCYNCKYLEELYAMARNDDGLFDRVLDDVVCRCPDKDDFVKGPCEHFKVVEGMGKDIKLVKNPSDDLHDLPGVLLGKVGRKNGK